MTIKIIDAEETGTGYDIVVDTDAGNTAEPEDGRLLRLSYGSFESSKLSGETRVQFLQRLRNEIRIAARARVAERTERTARVKVDALIGVDIT